MGIVLRLSLDYPTECLTVDAPATAECMQAIWLSEGCLNESSFSPDILTGAERSALDVMTVQ